MQFGRLPRTRHLAICAGILVVVVSFVGAGDARAQSEQQRALRLVQEAAVSQWPASANRWALIIGVDRYEDAQISQLGGAANDAHALKDALVSYAGFMDEHILLLSTKQSEGLRPTRPIILKYFSNLLARLRAEDLLVVAFAGHGIERSGEAFFSPPTPRSAATWSCLNKPRFRFRGSKSVS
jgi:hypothetical protein